MPLSQLRRSFLFHQYTSFRHHHFCALLGRCLLHTFSSSIFLYIFPPLLSSSLCLLHLLFTDLIQRSSYLQSLLYSILHAIVVNLLTLASSQSWYPRVRHHRLLSACFVHQLLDHHSSPRGMFAPDLCPSHSVFTYSLHSLVNAIQGCQSIVRPIYSVLDSLLESLGAILLLIYHALLSSPTHAFLN